VAVTVSITDAEKDVPVTITEPFSIFAYPAEVPTVQM